MSENKEMEHVTKFLEVILKLVTPLLMAVVLVVSTVCLFLSKSLLSSIGILDLIVKFKSYLGCAFLISLAYLVCYFLFWFYNKVKEKFEGKNDLKDLVEQLDYLSAYEKGLLKQFIENDTQSWRLPPDDPTVSGLVLKKILTPGLIGDMRRTPYTLQPWAWKHLKSNPELLNNATPYKPAGRFDR